ncbi:hypothetical protein [Leifsonia sp. AG29]|uniref:hypothetical protein n=1 Tax=Leifsonia sp. AG29 TaxID=2598860 RepID=UPI00131E3BAA|nr:hypothetical protein [Leifsonia sp. AG29]
MSMSGERPTDTPIYDSRRETLPEDDEFVDETEVVEVVEVVPIGTVDESLVAQPGYAPGAGYASGTPTGSGSGGMASAAKEEAGNLAGTTADAAKDVAGVAKEQVQNVAGEAKSQAQDLLRQTQEELRAQAAQQQQRVATGLRSVGDELDQMAGASDAQGMASDLARQAAQRAHSVAGWLDRRDPGSLLQELKSYARRNPGTFIAGAAIAGALAGRLTRALASGASEAHGSAGGTSNPGTLGGDL